MGYNGKILRVNLSEGEVKEEDLERDYAKEFLGGTGLAARYMLDLTDSDVNPLSPENPLIFMTGPLTGTGAPNSSRHAVCSYSPLTGIWGEGTSGGEFGMKLKMAGWDGIIIEGEADETVYLAIEDDEVEIREGSELEGLDTYETQDVIKEEMGKTASVSCIGVAGENLVNYACIINDEGRALGRCGMGAVMGSKNLKAVSVVGTSRPSLDDEEKFRDLTKEIFSRADTGLDPLLASDFVQKTSQKMIPLITNIPSSLLNLASEEIVDNVYSKSLEYFGTASWVGIGEAHGDVPVKYFTESEFEGAEEIDGFSMRRKILTDNYNCPACNIGCGRKVELSGDKYELDHDDGPEYETVAGMGPLLLIDDLEAIAYLNEVCNEYGLDTISTAVSIGFALHLFEKDIIDEDEVGFSLEWGDPEVVKKLIDMLVQQEGFGKILSQGVREMGKKYDAEDEAAHVKGLEMPMHDPRAFHSMAVTYATSPRGACHNRGDTFTVHLGSGEEEIGVESMDRFEKDGAGEMAAKYQDYRELYNAAPICEFASPGMEFIRDLVNFATGMKYSIDDLMEIGERSRNIKRILNMRRGITAEDDKLQDIMLRPIGGGTQDKVPDVDYMLSEYYEYRNWDEDTGRPRKEKLKELGLESLVSEN